MTDDVRELWESLESRKWRILESVARLPADVATQSRPNSWSPLQIVDHLIQAEKVMLKEADQAKSATGIAKRTLMQRMAVWVLRRGIRVPGPSSMAPTDPASIEDLGRRWADVRDELMNRINASPDTRPFSINSRLGPMNVVQALELTDAHLQYHQRQLGAV